LQGRIRSVIFAVVGAIGIFGCGLALTFVVAPRQALEAYRITRMPQMNAQSLEEARPGDEILLTGTLASNPPLVDDTDFVAYRLKRWEVTLPSSDDSDARPSGSWAAVETEVPALWLDVEGRRVRLLAAETMALSGRLHEEIMYSESDLTADYGGEPIPDGSLRYEGVYDDDVIAVLGQRASTGDLIPRKMYAGDRISFEESEKSGATGALFSGICLMGLAPLALIGGVLAALFRRRR